MGGGGYGGAYGTGYGTGYSGGYSAGGYGGYGGYSAGGYAAGGYAAPVAAAPVKVIKPAVKVTPVAKASGYTTIKSDCREVTKEVCVNTPKKTSETVEHKVQVPVAEPVVAKSTIIGGHHW